MQSRSPDFYARGEAPLRAKRRYVRPSGASTVRTQVLDEPEKSPILCLLVRLVEKLPRSLRFDPAFVLRNLVLWLTFCVLLTILNVTMHDRSVWTEMRGNIGVLVCCFTGTFLVRMFIKSPGENAPWRSIYFHAFLIGVPIASLLMTVLGLELRSFFSPDAGTEPARYLEKAFFGIWFFLFILFGGWAGVYVSILAVKRSNDAEVRQLESEKALREAELRVLKAQINPHFLFNSLNTIRALVNEHPERAQDAVLHLSLLLRAALQSESLLRPLREELATAQHYLELERLRFEERLRVRVEIPPALMDTPVPTMLVQILVENAVKHGISTAVGGGELSIVGVIDGDRCRIVVSNPGSLRGSPGGTGLGLRNARMRLERLVGSNAGIDISEEKGLVTATISMPYRRITV